MQRNRLYRFRIQSPSTYRTNREDDGDDNWTSSSSSFVWEGSSEMRNAESAIIKTMIKWPNHCSILYSNLCGRNAGEITKRVLHHKGYLDVVVVVPIFWALSYEYLTGDCEYQHLLFRDASLCFSDDYLPGAGRTSIQRQQQHYYISGDDGPKRSLLLLLMDINSLATEEEKTNKAMLDYDLIGNLVQRGDSLLSHIRTTCMNVVLLGDGKGRIPLGQCHHRLAWERPMLPPKNVIIFALRLTSTYFIKVKQKCFSWLITVV